MATFYLGPTLNTEGHAQQPKPAGTMISIASRVIYMSHNNRLARYGFFGQLRHSPPDRIHRVPSARPLGIVGCH
jgi:hypothetical protein